MTITAPKGTKDVLPNRSYRWQFVEQTIRAICAKYGMQEIRTPVFESTELFARGVGGTTDIVQKEMYTFLDKGGRSVTLKPEGTAGAVRMFIEHGLYAEAQPTKMYYLNSPIFRYERPQAGRLREHHQFGVEILGARGATADAEVIALALELFSTLGTSELVVKLNSIGCPNCRGAYQKALRDFLLSKETELCATCGERLQTNPLRVLDCKTPSCRAIIENTPRTTDYVCEDCVAHMNVLTECLDKLGVSYEIDPKLVRGLDYYTKTVFEIVSSKIGAQGTVCGGGRYDGLVQELGGPATPAVGFGLGLERLLLLMEQLDVNPEPPALCDIFIAPIGPEAVTAAFALVANLRERGLKADMDHLGRSLKAQLKYADKIGARCALPIGETELQSGFAKLKNMKTGEQVEVSIKTEEIIQCVMRNA
ncbi:MAG: histidine--tRNA ligase [Clostridiales bacterium]|nr:histidine--tRNA ligase [Clostridiales bacterium]